MVGVLDGAPVEFSMLHCTPYSVHLIFTSSHKGYKDVLMLDLKVTNTTK